MKILRFHPADAIKLNNNASEVGWATLRFIGLVTQVSEIIMLHSRSKDQSHEI
jgi:hypothetical protein